MKNRILTIALIILCSNIIQTVDGQTLVTEWAHTFLQDTLPNGVDYSDIFPFNDYDQGTGIAIDQANNNIQVGSYSGTFYNDTSALIVFEETYFQGFVRKRTSDGDVIWTKYINGNLRIEPADIVTDINNNLYICGFFIDSIDLDPSPASVIVSSGSTGKIKSFLIKLDSNGDFVFGKTWVQGGDIKLVQIELGSGGDIYLAGSYSGNTDVDPGPASILESAGSGTTDGLVLRLNDNGEYLDHYVLDGTPSAAIIDFTIDDDSSIYVVGQFTGASYLNPIDTTLQLISTAFSDGILLKLNSNLNYAWSHQFASNSDAYYSNVVVKNGEIAVSVSFSASSTQIYGNDTVEIENPYNTLSFVIQKFDTSGNHIKTNAYAHESGSGEIETLQFDEYQNLYAIGTFGGAIDFSAGAGTDIDSVSNIQTFILVLDQGYQNAKHFSLDGEFLSYRSALDKFGAIYLSGEFIQTFNAGIVQDSSFIYNEGWGGVWEALLVKIDDLNEYSSISEDACDGYLSPSGTYIWNVGGTYKDTIPLVSGGDSVLTIVLNVIYTTRDTFSLTVCDQYISPSGKYNWTTTGIYFDTLYNAAGCDTVLVYDLTINAAFGMITELDSNLLSIGDWDSHQWLDCDDNYNKVWGQRDSIFTPESSGNYAVEVTFNGCTDTSTCYYYQDALGVDEMKVMSFQIYPNPSNGSFHLNFEEILVNAEVKIWSVVGSILFMYEGQKGKVIPIQTNLASGLYFVTVTKANGQQMTQKISVK